LPQELRQGDNPARSQLWALGGDSLARTGFAAVTLEEVAKIFSIVPKESLSPQISRRLAASLQSSGFCIEPDARLTGKGYRWNERVVLFDPQESMADDFVGPDVVARYQTCAFLLKVSFYVAKAGGEVRQDALTLIAQSLFDLLLGASLTVGASRHWPLCS
jgi:hypothetical protein